MEMSVRKEEVSEASSGSRFKRGVDRAGISKHASKRNTDKAPSSRELVFKDLDENKIN